MLIFKYKNNTVWFVSMFPNSKKWLFSFKSCSDAIFPIKNFWFLYWKKIILILQAYSIIALLYHTSYVALCTMLNCILNMTLVPHFVRNFTPILSLTSKKKPINLISEKVTAPLHSNDVRYQSYTQKMLVMMFTTIVYTIIVASSASLMQ